MARSQDNQVTIPGIVGNTLLGTALGGYGASQLLDISPRMLVTNNLNNTIDALSTAGLYAAPKATPFVVAANPAQVYRQARALTPEALNLAFRGGSAENIRSSVKPLTVFKNILSGNVKLRPVLLPKSIAQVEEVINPVVGKAAIITDLPQASPYINSFKPAIVEGFNSLKSSIGSRFKAAPVKTGLAGLALLTGAAQLAATPYLLGKYIAQD